MNRLAWNRRTRWHSWSAQCQCRRLGMAAICLADGAAISLTYAKCSSWPQDLLMYSHVLTLVMQILLLSIADVMQSFNSKHTSLQKKQNKNVANLERGGRERRLFEIDAPSFFLLTCRESGKIYRRVSKGSSELSTRSCKTKRAACWSSWGRISRRSLRRSSATWRPQRSPS